MSYSPTLGRWVQQDPAGYVDGANAYQYTISNPLAYLDPVGLEHVWYRPTGLEIPQDTDIDDLEQATRYRDEAWNKAGQHLEFYHHGYVNSLAPGGDRYDPINKEKYYEFMKLWKKWADQVWKLEQACCRLKQWLKDHPNATYGPYGGDGPRVSNPGSRNYGPNS